MALRQRYAILPALRRRAAAPRCAPAGPDASVAPRAARRPTAIAGPPPDPPRHRCPRCRPALPAPPPGSTNVPAAANVSPPNAAAQTASCSPAASATEEAVPAAGRCSPSRNYSGSNRPAVLSHPAATIVTERSLRPGHLHRRLDATISGGSTVHAVRLWPTGSALRPCWRAAIIRQYGRVGRRGACVAGRCPLVGATVLGGVGCVAGKRVAQCSEQEAAPGPAERRGCSGRPGRLASPPGPVGHTEYDRSHRRG